MNVCAACKSQIMAWVLAEKSRYEDLMVQLAETEEPVQMETQQSLGVA